VQLGQCGIGVAAEMALGGKGKTALRGAARETRIYANSLALDSDA